MEEDKKVKMVPAICTQCGATLEVDPSLEAAVCKHCNTPFIVEKAINNYNVKFANIEHADNVNIDLTGTVKEVLNFADKQISESRQAKKELRKIEGEKDKQFIRTFFTMFLILCALTMVFWLIANFFGLFD